MTNQLKYRRNPQGVHASFNNWDLKMYRFGQFRTRISVLIELFFRFFGLNDFFYGFAVFNGP